MSPMKPRTPTPATETPQPSDAPPQSRELKADEVEERVVPSRFRLSANHNETVLTQA